MGAQGAGMRSRRTRQGEGGLAAHATCSAHSRASGNPVLDLSSCGSGSPLSRGRAGFCFCARLSHRCDCQTAHSSLLMVRRASWRVSNHKAAGFASHPSRRVACATLLRLRTGARLLAVFFAAPGAPSSLFSPRRSEGMERRKARPLQIVPRAIACARIVLWRSTCGSAFVHHDLSSLNSLAHGRSD